MPGKEQFVDTIVVLGRTKDENLDHATHSSSLATQLLANAQLTDNVIAISSGTGLKLMDEYFKKLGAEKPLIKQERTTDEAGQIRQLIKDGTFGEIGLMTAEGSNETIIRELKDEGVTISKISPDEEARRIVDSAGGSSHGLGTVIQIVSDLLRYGSIKNVQLSRLSLSKT